MKSLKVLKSFLVYTGEIMQTSGGWDKTPISWGRRKTHIRQQVSGGRAIANKWVVDTQMNVSPLSNICTDEECEKFVGLDYNQISWDKVTISINGKVYTFSHNESFALTDRDVFRLLQAQ